MRYINLYAHTCNLIGEENEMPPNDTNTNDVKILATPMTG